MSDDAERIRNLETELASRAAQSEEHQIARQEAELALTRAREELTERCGCRVDLGGLVTRECEQHTALRRDRDDGLDNIAERDARVTRVLARATEIENERRMWKHRATSATAILHDVFVEVPILEHGQRMPASEVREMLAGVRAVAERADMLEKDAWTQWAPVVRSVVAEMWPLVPDGTPPPEDRLAYLLERVAGWRDRLSKLVA